MSKELNDLKNKLWTAAASVTEEQTAQDTNTSNDPSFSSSEAAVQAILESLRNNEFSTAILYIQECRYNHRLMQAFSALISMWIKFGNEKTFSRSRSPVVIQQSGSFRAYFMRKQVGVGLKRKLRVCDFALGPDAFSELLQSALTASSMLSFLPLRSGCLQLEKVQLLPSSSVSLFSHRPVIIKEVGPTISTDFGCH